LDRTRAGGFEVSRAIEGSERVLPPQVDLAAFRIIQEALTNVRRHSNADRAEIILLYADDVLTVRVDDRGIGGIVPKDSNGRGIEGMRERAQALGGALTAGPLPGGGFRVEARLPLAGGDQK
jgi:signal transduction histidine kinase